MITMSLFSWSKCLPAFDHYVYPSFCLPMITMSPCSWSLCLSAPDHYCLPTHDHNGSLPLMTTVSLPMITMVPCPDCVSLFCPWPLQYVSLPLIVLCLPKTLLLLSQSMSHVTICCCLPFPHSLSQSLSPPPPSVSHRFISMSLHVYFLIFSSFLVFLYTFQFCLCVLYEACPSHY
jgi:hypothetical protein